MLSAWNAMSYVPFSENFTPLHLRVKSPLMSGLSSLSGGVYGDDFGVMPGTLGTAVHSLVDLST